MLRVNQCRSKANHTNPTAEPSPEAAHWWTAVYPIISNLSYPANLFFTRCIISLYSKVLLVYSRSFCYFGIFIVLVIRLKGRRTPHQDLKGSLIEITQPSISNQWATGRPPLVLISHPSGMTPDEERFYTENRSTCLSQNWAWMGAPICPHL